MGLQYNLLHWMGTQRTVQLVKLLAAGSSDGDGDAQVFSAFAFAQFDGGGVKCRVKCLCNDRDGVHQALDLEPHDFDGELRGILNQRISAGWGLIWHEKSSL